MFLWPLKKKLGVAAPDIIIGKDVQKDLEFLLDECRKHLKNFDEALIKKAFLWCVDVHKNKVRRSGEPYYTHPLSVALIVVSEMPLDDISVVSALLHNVVDEGDTFGLKDIQSEFGTTIAEIVEYITKIKFIESHNIEQLENYRRLLLSLFKDVRIILIKLADRLHNLRTLDTLPEEKQKRIAEDTLEIYAPFAQRFGLGNIKWELEDLAFKFGHKEAYAEIRKELQLNREEREEYIRKFAEPIEEQLQKDTLFRKKNIKYEIIGRPKHIYSIYNKMLIRGVPMSELYDLFAIRIILDTDDSSFCFIVYGIISDIYKPVPATFKDYISNPKKNGYQSIHTALIGPDNRPVEVQIRTRKMHEISERGVAAHFNYKRGFLPAQSVLDDKNIEEWMSLVRNIFENAGDEAPEQLLESVRKNLFSDEIFVFTPANEFRIFPKDSTPLDFAYAIHTDIGDHCIGAKVNGKVVPLNYKLQSGDLIEILTSAKQLPSKEWLKCVVTHRAKSNILKWLKDERRNAEDEGKKIWLDIVGKTGISINEFEFNRYMQILKFKNKSDFFFALGTSSLDISLLNETIQDKIKDIKNDITLKKIESPQAPNGNGKEQINTIKRSISETSVKVSYATCCHPLPGDEIVGVIKSGRDIIVHRRECETIKYLLNTHQPALFELDWSTLSVVDFTVKLRISGEDRPTMLADISSAILTTGGMSIQGINFDTADDDGFSGLLTLNVKNLDKLNIIFDTLQKIDGIKSVERFTT